MRRIEILSSASHGLRTVYAYAGAMLHQLKITQAILANTQTKLLGIEIKVRETGDISELNPTIQ